MAAAGAEVIVSGALALSTFGFVALRTINGYSEPMPWQAEKPRCAADGDGVLNLTKCPPSADFLLLTLGCGAWLLSAAFERLPARPAAVLAVFGALLLHPPPLSAARG